MSEAGVRVAAFHGPVDVQGGLFLTLSGRGLDGEPLLATFGAPAPADLPAMLESPAIEQVGPGHRIVAGGRAWLVAAGALHLHRGVPSFYTALPPRVPSWHRRLLFRLLVALAARPAGLALLRRLRG